MKKGIHTLIKLRKRELDELRRKMVGLESQKQQFINSSMRLDNELQHEITMAGKQPEMSHFFGGFAKRIRLRQEQIMQEILLLDKQMEKLSVQISDAFSELKKFEIAEANAKKRERAAEARRETIALDEVAGQRHSRRTNEHA